VCVCVFSFILSLSRAFSEGGGCDGCGDAGVVALTVAIVHAKCHCVDAHPLAFETTRHTCLFCCFFLSFIVDTLASPLPLSGSLSPTHLKFYRRKQKIRRYNDDDAAWRCCPVRLPQRNRPRCLAILHEKPHHAQCVANTEV